MKMDYVKDAVLAVVATVGAVVSEALGGWDHWLALLMALMGLDYLTGVLVAWFWKRSPKTSSGKLSSEAGFKGLVKKGVILLVVGVAVMLDRALGETYVRVMVILFFVGNEGLSLLENIGLMGVPFPAFLKGALEALREEGDKGEHHESC